MKENARTTDEMMKKSTFVHWDFENIWGIDESVSSTISKTSTDIIAYRNASQ